MMDTNAVIRILESQINTSSSDGVSEQRARNHRFYTMQPIGNEQAGRSHYISPDVLDGVESAKAVFAETFFSGRDVVRFMPLGDGDSEEAAKRTAYVSMQLEQNNWTSLFRDGWHDAFVAKRMVMHAGWKKKRDTIEIPVQSLTQEQLATVIQVGGQRDVLVDVDTSALEMMQDPATGVGIYNGTMMVDVDRSYVKLSLVQPERFYRDPDATYLQDSSYCAWERRMAKWELVDMGFSAEQVQGLRPNYRFRANEEDTARKDHDQSSKAFSTRASSADSHDQVSVYVTYTWLTAGDIDGQGEMDDPRLYEIWWGHGEILEWTSGKPAIREVDAIPFFEWTEYKIAHAEHGMSLADVMAPTQRVNSVLKRLVIDNQQMRNTTRYEAVHGAVKNPRDLIDNKIGGVVWTRQIGSVMPLATPELSPLTIQAIEVMNRDSEARSGMSSLSKGMNHAAINNQNASDMIERLTNAGNRRVMRAARDFANSFLIPLSKFIYRLGVQNDRRAHNVEIGGRFVRLAPSQWPDSDIPMRAQLALTKEECVTYAQSLMMMHQMMSMDPDCKVVYGTTQKHALFDDMFDALGIPDASRYMLAPDSPEYQQTAQQMAAAQQQQMAQQQEAQQASLQLAVSEDKRKWTDTNARSQGEFDKAMDRKMDNVRQMEEFNWQKYVEARELALKQEEINAKATADAKRPAGPAPFAGR